MSDPLKLFVRDEETLNVLSACLQDAIVPISDIAYLPAEQRFVLVVNRFKWEDCEDECLMGACYDSADASNGNGAHSNGANGHGAGADSSAANGVDGAERGFERTLCGICFDGVRSVKTKQVDLSRRDQILSLLALAHTDRFVELHFCGGEAIRLEVDDVRCRADDMGNPWLTHHRPQHPIQDVAETSAG